MSPFKTESRDSPKLNPRLRQWTLKKKMKLYQPLTLPHRTAKNRTWTDSTLLKSDETAKTISGPPPQDNPFPTIKDLLTSSRIWWHKIHSLGRGKPKIRSEKSPISTPPESQPENLWMKDIKIGIPTVTLWKKMIRLETSWISLSKT